jgi:hypothetical protein
MVVVVVVDYTLTQKISKYTTPSTFPNRRALQTYILLDRISDQHLLIFSPYAN